MIISSEILNEETTSIYNNYERHSQAKTLLENICGGGGDNGGIWIFPILFFLLWNPSVVEHGSVSLENYKFNEACPTLGKRNLLSF